MENAVRGQTILVVDDDDQLRVMLADYLDSLGYRTVQADTGQNAIDIIPNHDFDLIICDIRMPVMNGVRLLETVKVISPKPPIIIMTGYIPSPKQKVSIAAMADAYLKKPFTLRTLTKTIEKLINN